MSKGDRRKVRTRDKETDLPARIGQVTGYKATTSLSTRYQPSTSLPTPFLPSSSSLSLSPIGPLLNENGKGYHFSLARLAMIIFARRTRAIADHTVVYSIAGGNSRLDRLDRTATLLPAQPETVSSA